MGALLRSPWVNSLMHAGVRENASVFLRIIAYFVQKRWNWGFRWNFRKIQYTSNEKTVGSVPLRNKNCTFSLLPDSHAWWHGHLSKSLWIQVNLQGVINPGTLCVSDLTEPTNIRIPPSTTPIPSRSPQAQACDLDWWVCLKLPKKCLQ